MNENERGTRPGPPATDDGIGDLIRSAGRRPAVPDDDLAALKDAARSAWRRMAAEQRRRRVRRRSAFALAASVLFALAGAWWWLHDGAPVGPQAIATVELVSGRVDAFPGAGDEARVTLSPDDSLSVGAVVETAGAGGGEEASGLVALRWIRGQSVRLDAGTRLRIVSPSRLALERGAVYVDSRRSAGDGGDLEIVTALGTVREIGTQYEVRLQDEGGAMLVRVREGEVSVHREGEAHTAARGEQLALLGDGAVARTAMKADDPAWLWVLETAPSIDIEGRSLASFLDWVGRETGREVRYADGKLARSAETIRLHGTIEGLRPDEALAVIVQGSGLDYRLEDGVALVFRP